MPRKLRPDDDVRRFASVWLGPPGYSFPWRARYLAYMVGFAIFAAILLIEAITPLHVGIPPIRELAVTMLATTAIMTAVNHDVPLNAAIRNVVNVLRAPRPNQDQLGTSRVRPVARRVKITRTPIHLDPEETHEVAEQD